MTAEPADIVPFGKYKGRPVVDLIADRSYTDWLAAQPWFRQRYGHVYNLIIHTGGEPQDTPEHNALQARFLDHDEALRLARFWLKDGAALLDEWEREYGGALSEAQRANLVFAETHRAKVRELTFETGGWDFCVTGLSYLKAREVEADQACTCVCEPGRCGGYGADNSGEEHLWSQCYVRYSQYLRISKVDTRRQKHCGSDCPSVWMGSYGYNGPLRGALSSKADVAVELKPTLGDDYPSVLRDVVKRREMFRARGGRMDLAVVLVDDVTFTSVSYDKVKKIFRSQGVRLLTTEELPELEETWLCSCAECTED